MTDDSKRKRTVVVTASQRLARHLRLRQAEQRAAAGESAWIAPSYISWDSWLTELWSDAAYRPGVAMPVPVLTPHQSRVLWERATARALGDVPLARMASLASRAAESWQRASEWRVSREELAAAARSPDATFLARAVGHYTAGCLEGGWQDPATLASAVADRVRERAIVVEDALEFAGFERLSPARRLLIDSLERQGTLVALRRPAGHQGAVTVRPAPDRDGELRAAGGWARERLQANPAARVGIVVPNLAGHARRAARLIAEGADPGWQLRPEGGHGINVSYGPALADYGLIDTALALLDIVIEDPDFVALSRLLRSPFLAGGTLEARAALEVMLRDLPDRRWELGRIGTALPRALPPEAADFLRMLTDTAARRAEWQARALPSMWAERIDGLLESAGWAAGGPLDSDSWQLVNAWRGVLNQLAGTGRVSGEIAGTSAIRQIGAIARQTLFQPESDADSVQVMGVLEASGMSFDALWVSGLDTTTWPPPQRPDPLLPIALQREHGMPDASPADTLEYAARIYSALIGSAPEVVVSWPRREGDAELIPSPFLQGVPAGPGAAPPVYAATRAGRASLQSVSPDPAPPLAADESLPGGHGVLSAQRTQPFDAFVQYRLRARPLETPVAGLSARERGTVIHRALEAVYRCWPSQHRLAEAGAAARSRAARTAVESALARYATGADQRLAGLIAMESGRCVDLIAGFVEQDLARPAFDQVLCEERREVRVGPLTLAIRPDRIERAGDGWMVIDYKTGASGTATGDHPDDPRQLQLVVYAISQTGPVQALAVAIVHPHRLGYTGVRDSEFDWPGRALKPIQDWPALLNAWKARAHALAQAVAAGDARLNLSRPLDEQRPYAVLSRIAELARGE